MRTIKFRAWDEENKIMVYQDTHTFMFNKYGVSVDKYNEWGDYDGLMAVSEPIMMQFTGLHDKNGKEIYEGDIVKTWWEYKDRISGKPVFKDIEVGEVKFGNYETDGDGQGYGNDSITGFYIEKNNSFPDSLRNNFIETIGNIYENPELI